MKSILLLSFAAALAMPAAAAERHYSLTDFERVQVEGPYQVRLATGLATSAKATGTQQALDRVTVEVQGSTLRIRPNHSSWGGYPGQAADPPAVIVLTARSLRGVTVSGSGSVTVDKAGGLRLDLAIAGSGRIAIAAIEADNLGLNMLGSGRASLAGKVKLMRATLQGAAELDAPGLRVVDLQLNAETAGNVALAASHTAKLHSTGAGDVTIAGNPACTVEALGSGTVHCGH